MKAQGEQQYTHMNWIKCLAQNSETVTEYNRHLIKAASALEPTATIGNPVYYLRIQSSKT